MLQLNNSFSKKPSPRRRSPRLFHPPSTMLEARKWASNSVPRLIVFAIGLHLVMSALLLTKIQGINNNKYNNSHENGQGQEQEHNRETMENNNVKEPKGLVASNKNNDAALMLPPSSFTIHIDHQAVHTTTNRLRITRISTLQTQDAEVAYEEGDGLYVKHLMDMNEKLQQALKGVVHSVSCRWRQPQSHSIYPENCVYHLDTANTLDNIADKDDPAEKRVVLFNPLEQERILCDGTRLQSAEIRVLPPGQTDLECSEPPRLFQEVPTINTKQEMNPIGLRFRQRLGQMKDVPCDVPCQTDGEGGVLSQRNVAGAPFSLLFSMEGPQYYNNLRIDPTAHRYNRFYSTTSFKSEVPLPYFSLEEYGDRLQAGPAVDYDNAIKGAVFIARNCQSRNNREGLVKSLIDSNFRVDSVSKCLNNAEKPGNSEKKSDIQRHYLFYLAFENQCENDYITEKLWATLEAGVVPVYYGAPNIAEHVPPHSIIDANSFETSQQLAEYLNVVANNRTLYESYHEWRKLPLPESFNSKYKFTEVHSTCRTCRWAFAKKYGLGWNHTLQTVEDVGIARQTCHDNEMVLTHPFQETWLMGDASRILATTDSKRSSLKTCVTRGTQLERRIQVGDRTLTRTVRNQDGVTDILLNSTNSVFPKSESVILQMKTTIQGDATSSSLIRLSANQYRFQDSVNRFTILANRNIKVFTSGKGTLAMRISNLNVPLRLRVIVENIDNNYDDMVNRTNYFGRAMTEDFFNPLEKFVIWGTPQKENDWVGKNLLSAGIITTKETEEEIQDDETMQEEEDARKAAKHEEAESIKAALIKVQDDAKTKRDSLALQGVKKLISMGIIKIAYSDDEDK